MNNILLSSLLILSSLLLCNLVFYGLRRREIPGVLVFSILMLAMIIHSVGYAFELLSDSLEYMYFWIKIEYIGIAFYPFLIMLFAREYADEKKFATKNMLILLLTINITTLVLVYTNSYHCIFYSSMGVDCSQGFNRLALYKGIWYFVHVFSLYFSIFYSVITFSIKVKKSKGAYRKKVAFMLAGVLIPTITLFVYIFGFGPINIDLTPFSYFLMTILIIIGLMRYDILVLTPITYEMVFNSIGETVLVIDKNEILLSFNSASKELFPSLSKVKIGESIHLIDELNEYDFVAKPTIYEGYGKILSFKINYIKENKVSIFVVNDITESERVKKQLEVLATHDALTGLYNRRYFMGIVEDTVKKGIFVMIDIDLFKNINDTFGHLAGDKVINYFAKEILKIFKTHLTCRYGGEEFIIFIENANIYEAYKLVEVLRKNVNDEDSEMKFTFSAGLAEYMGGDVTEVINKADEKLYQAKKCGRNQTQY